MSAVKVDRLPATAARRGQLIQPRWVRDNISHCLEALAANALTTRLPARPRSSKEKHAFTFMADATLFATA
jgi:hypothetical protein